MAARRIAPEPPVLRRKRRGMRWDHVALEPYKPPAPSSTEFRGASRQVLVGKHGERVGFHVRYFELEPGGFTTLERHHHSHVVIGVRGRGRVRVGETDYRLSPLDTIYIGPNATHQLNTVGRGRFGFLCLVDARRDRPKLVRQPARR